MQAWQSMEKQRNVYSSLTSCPGRGEVPPPSVCPLPSSSGPLPPGVAYSPVVSQVSICSSALGSNFLQLVKCVFDPGPKSKFLVTTPDKEIYHQ